MTQETKVCSKCGQEKPIGEFRWLNKLNRHQSRCRDCERAYSRKYHSMTYVSTRKERAIEQRLADLNAFKVLELLTKQKDFYMTKLKTLQTNIEQWAVDRHLHTGNPRRQALKLLEEHGELVSASIRNNYSEVVDAIGDITVVAVILAKQLNIPIDLSSIFEQYTTCKTIGASRDEAIINLAESIVRAAQAVHNDFVGSTAFIPHVILLTANVAELMGVDFITAVQIAYDTIKDRKGTLINGVFVKEGD